MTAHASTQSSVTSRRKSGHPIVDISSIKSYLHGNATPNNHRRRDASLDDSGNNSSRLGLTKSTKDTTGTWSSNENNSPRAAGNKRVVCLDDKLGRDAQLGDNSRGRGVVEAVRSVASGERGGRSRSRPREESGGPPAGNSMKAGLAAISRGRSSSRPRNSDRSAGRNGTRADPDRYMARSRSLPRNRMPRSPSNSSRHQYDEMSSLASNGQVSAISVAAAATRAAAAALSAANDSNGGDGRRSRSRSRPRDRSHGEREVARRSLSRPREGEVGRRSLSRPRTATAPGRDGDDAILDIAAAAASLAAVGADRHPTPRRQSFNGLKPDFDKIQASLDSHHHRMGRQYRSSGESRGKQRRGQSRSRSPERSRGCSPQSSRGCSPQSSRGGMISHAGSRSTVRMHNNANTTPGRYRSRSPAAARQQQSLQQGLEMLRRKEDYDDEAAARSRSRAGSRSRADSRGPGGQRSLAQQSLGQGLERLRRKEEDDDELAQSRSRPRSDSRSRSVGQRSYYSEHRSRASSISRQSRNSSGPRPMPPQRGGSFIDRHRDDHRGRSHSRPRQTGTPVRSHSQPREQSRRQHTPGRRPRSPNRSARDAPSPVRWGHSPMGRTNNRAASRSPPRHQDTRRGGTPGPTRGREERYDPGDAQRARRGTPGPTRRSCLRSQSPGFAEVERHLRSQSPGRQPQYQQRGGTPGPRGRSPHHRRGGTGTPGPRRPAARSNSRDSSCYTSSSSAGKSSVSSSSHGRGTAHSVGSNQISGACSVGTQSVSVDLDANGCCIRHPFVQLQRPKPNGGGWRIMSKTCALCVDEAEERERNGGNSSTMATTLSLRNSADAVAKADAALAEAAAANARQRAQIDHSATPQSAVSRPATTSLSELSTPHPLERQHSQYNTTSGKRGSLLPVDAIPSSASSAGSSRAPQEDEDEDCSITPSFLESDDGEPSVVSNTSSKRSASSKNKDQNKESKEAKKKVKAKKKDGKAAAAPIDMTRVESALQKIKSMEKIQATTTTSVSEVNQPTTTTPKQEKSSRRSSNHKGTSNSANAKRPIPPPPPPRKIHINPDSNNSNVDMSMAVLNPHPEPELTDDFPLTGLTIMPQQPDFLSPVQGQAVQRQAVQGQTVHGQAVQRQAVVQGQTTVPGQVVDRSKEWMKYSAGATRQEQAENNGKKSKLKGRVVPPRHANNERQVVRHVKQMPFTDQFGDFGYYTGQVNEDGQPNGKGSMKYENGVFYEGTWTDGCQDQKAALQYSRIRGGFTSWSGKGKSGTKSGSVLPWNARKNDAHDPNEKTNVRGMEWTDLNGDTGRYTGQVNNDQLPHGKGIMRYAFGLIAEGDWINGVLKEGPQDRVLAMNGGQGISSGVSVGPGMSVGPGAAGFTSGAVSVCGMQSVGGNGSVHHVLPMGMPVLAMANQTRQATQFNVIAHQNAMMKGMYGGGGSVYSGYGGGSVYGGAGSVYGGSMPMQQMHQQQMMMQQQQQAMGTPPLSEIKFT